MKLLKITDDTIELFNGINISIDENIDYNNLVDIINNIEKGILIAKIKSKMFAELSRFPQSIDLLYQNLIKEKNMLVRKSILSSLFIIGGDEVVRLLVPLLASQDADLRNSILETLHSLPEYLEQYIKILLQHSDENVRIFGIEFLSSFSDSFVVDSLMDLINKESNINVCVAAVERLINIEKFNNIKVIQDISVRFPDAPFIKFLIDMASEKYGLRKNNGN